MALGEHCKRYSACSQVGCNMLQVIFTENEPSWHAVALHAFLIVFHPAKIEPSHN
jgi:hypothetical protein